VPAPLIAFVNDITGLAGSGCQLLWSRTARHLQQTGGARIAIAFRNAARTEMPEVRELLDGGALFDVETSTARWPARLARRILRRPPVDPQSGTVSWLAALRPDLVLINQSAWVGVDLWGPQLAAHGLRFATLSHCVDLHMWPGDERNRALRAGFAGAARNFVVSRGNQRLLETMLAEPLPRSAAAFNPYRVDFAAPFAWPATTAPLKLACVARLFPPAKGQDLILQVLARDEWRGRDLRVTFAGDGPHGEALRRLAVSLGVADKVEFAGHVSDIREIWRDHHALLLPSRFEGMAIAVVEALLSGRPVITTDLADNRTYVQEGETGFIAETPTVAAAAAAMERAWQARGQWQEMGATAHARAREFFPREPEVVFAAELLALARDRTP
jgi:glycosyltransferase involved in cell wall biosynthesis